MTTFNLPTDVAVLQEMVINAYTNRNFGCLTKAGLLALHTYTEGMSIVFCDVNGMHAANKKYTYAGVDRRIKASIGCRETDTVAAQWMSGDEFLFVVPTEDAEGFAARIAQAFIDNGLSAMFGIAELTQDLDASVMAAADVVVAQKATRDNTWIRRAVRWVKKLLGMEVR
jgi:hypothetical protein